MNRPDTPPGRRESRNALPHTVARLQAILESEHKLRYVLGLDDSIPIKTLRIRRNLKFRKLTVMAGDERYICYMHYLPRGLRNLYHYSQLMQSRGVHTPQPSNARLQWRHTLSNGLFSLIFPWINGTALGPDVEPTVLGSLGRSLGSLHQIRSTQSGPLMTNFRSHGNYQNLLKRYWKQTERQLLQHAEFAKSDEISQALTRIESDSECLRNLEHFSLTHGDLAGGNILRQSDDTLCLIDCDRIGFEPGCMELANALFQSYCTSYDHRENLISAYLEHCPQDIAELWHQHAHFFVAHALLWRTQRKLQWSVKRPDGQHSQQRAAHAWSLLDRVLSSRSNGDWRETIALLD